MLTIEQLQTRLSEALDAQHRLMLGEQAVQVRDSDGSMVSYSAANASRLSQYIAWLQAELRALQSPLARAPIRPVWG